MTTRPEFILEAYAILSRNDKPLLVNNLSKENSDLDISMLFEASLDYFDEQMSLLLKGPQPVSGNLGLLQRHDSRLLFGKILSNGVKLILLFECHFGLQPNESVLEECFNCLIKTYLAEISNPFYSHDDKPFSNPQLHTLPDGEYLLRQ